MKPNQPISPTPLPALPKSWSELTWQQLCDCWQVKLRYGGNADVARAAAFIALLQTSSQNPRNGDGRADGASGWRTKPLDDDHLTGEKRHLLTSLHYGRGRGWVCTARELSWMAKQFLPWFDFPYGDPGDKEEKDEKGNIIKERREGVRGYVSNMKDAMVLPIEEIGVASEKLKVKSEKLSLFTLRSSLFTRWFALPQPACANLTWEQYRALQNIVPQLFAEGNTDEQAVELQAQFLAHILTPRSFALFDTTGGNIKIRPHYVYHYNSERADKLVPFWKKGLSLSSITGGAGGVSVLFHLCFQVYQTALSYYEASYPILFGGGGKQDPLKDALTLTAGTLNTIMKYQGYAKPEDVDAENITIIFDVLNTMTNEAKEIEKMNAKIKKK